jgi:L-lactate dehydrogenase (cytochrome)
MSLDDFEEGAKRKIPGRTFAYFHSAADDLRSVRTNKLDWEKVSLRPRVLRNVAHVNMRCTVMGQRSRLPIFIAPAARAKMAHEDGELCLARGAARKGIPYCVSSYSSVGHDELAACVVEEKRGEEGCLFFQLYVQKTKEATEGLIKMAKDLGFNALAVTVDTNVIGKREEDERYNAQLSIGSGEVVPPATAIPTSSRHDKDLPILRGVHSSTLNWEDLVWIRQAWGSQPIVLKGIQTAEDAYLASRADVDGIYLSNHGGRQVDDAPSAIRTLLEIRRFCPQVLRKVDVYLDGGVRRGSDIIKALCLGAKGVGIGRPFMYSLAYGTEGVERAVQSM